MVLTKVSLTSGSGLDTLPDDLLLLADVHLHHEGDDVVTLVTLQQNDLLAGLGFDNRTVALEVFPHVLQDLLEVELRVETLNKCCALAAISLLDTNRDSRAVALVGLTNTEQQVNMEKQKTTLSKPSDKQN